jgi:hypothetical protein
MLFEKIELREFDGELCELLFFADVIEEVLMIVGVLAVSGEFK